MSSAGARSGLESVVRWPLETRSRRSRGDIVLGVMGCDDVCYF